MVDPGLISAGVGLLSSFFGGGNKLPAVLEQNYRMQQAIWKKQMELYNNTDLAAEDAKALADYTPAVWANANKMLANYDAKAAGQGGSPIYQGDTVKDRARGQIAGDAAGTVANLAFQQATSRALREKALLPNAGDVANGMQGALALDNQGLMQQAQQQQGLMSVAEFLAGLWNKGQAKGGAKGQNDAYMSGSSGSTGGSYGSPVKF